MFTAAREKISMWIGKYNKPEYLLVSTNLPSLNQLVEQAKIEWHQAMAYFERVNDPELVDYAINNLEAAERRYNYLLKQLREQ